MDFEAEGRIQFLIVFVTRAPDHLIVAGPRLAEPVTSMFEENCAAFRGPLLRVHVLEPEKLAQDRVPRTSWDPRPPGRSGATLHPVYPHAPLAGRRAQAHGRRYREEALALC